MVVSFGIQLLFALSRWFGEGMYTFNGVSTWAAYNLYSWDLFGMSWYLLFTVSSYFFCRFYCMFLLYPSCLQNFKKIENQLLCHQINVKVSSFCDLKLCVKNKLMIE